MARPARDGGGRPRRVENPPNPWATERVEWLGEPPAVELEVFEEEARSALSENASPDVPFRYGVNAYRGCQHACAYCYARPTHEYLGFGAGTDFDAKVVVKTNLPEVLARELARPSWRREVVCVSGNTDPYQPLEASYRLTRRVLEVLLARRTPVTLITKGALVRRDADLLARLAREVGATVNVSVPFADEGHARALEPGAPTPAVRFETIRVLSRAGVPVSVSISPLVPGLNEPQVAEVLERAAEAGATAAWSTLLRLPGSTAEVFETRLRRALPERADRVLSALREARGGRLHDPRFGARMRGSGARVEAVDALFRIQARRLGLSVPGEGREPGLPERPAPERQRELFGA